MTRNRITHFCTDDINSIVYQEYEGAILDHHANTREIKVARFRDNNAAYFDKLLNFIDSCIFKIDEDDNSVLLNVRLGALYFDAKLKDSHSQSRYRRQDFNSEAGAKFEDNRESVEEYVSQKGFTSKSRNEKLKVNCKGGHRYAYEMENLEPVFEDEGRGLGIFDIVHNRNDGYLEDVRIKITSLKPISSSSPSLPLIAKNENSDLILLNSRKVLYVRKQESSLYFLNEEQSQLDGISIHFRLDKKTQLDHTHPTLTRCMTTFTGAQIIISGSKDSFKKEKDFIKRLAEIVYDYCEWLSKLCAELDIGSDYSVLYYEPGNEQGYTREQDLVIQEVAKASSRYTSLRFSSKDEFTRWRNSFSEKLQSASNHPRYHETLQSFQWACDRLSDGLRN